MQYLMLKKMKAKEIRKEGGVTDVWYVVGNRDLFISTGKWACRHIITKIFFYEIIILVLTLILLEMKLFCDWLALK